MKKTLSIFSFVAAALILQSCAGRPDRPIGFIYTRTSFPISASAASGNLIGVSHATSYFGLIAVGDASIQAAKEASGINTVSSVDKRVTSVLGLYAEYTTTVRGN